MIAVVVNALFISGYVWSRGGQTTHIRVEVRGDEFSSYVDGHLRNRERLDAPPEGGVIISPEPPQRTDSLPSPRGAHRVLVTDLQSGQALYDREFSSAAGAATSPEDPAAELRDGKWRDYAVDVEYRNILQGGVSVRVTPAGGVGFVFRRLGFNFASFYLFRQGQQPTASPLVKADVDSVESVKALVAMALNWYPFAALLMLGMLIVGSVVALAVSARPPDFAWASSRALPWLAVGALALAAFIVCAVLITPYGVASAYVADESAYLFQGRLLAAGRTHIAPPPVPEAFSFTTPPFMVDYGGRWASFYPFGHPLVLAVGLRFGAVWLIPPMLAAASVALIFVVGRGMFGLRTGLLSALLLAGSPFFLMNGSNFMSHNTAGFYVLASLAALIRSRERPVIGGILGGLFFGLLFNTRPLAAVMLVPPLAGLIAAPLIARESRGAGVRASASFALGGLLMLVAYVLYNHATTGQFFENGYQASGDLSQSVGFGGAHSVASGIDNEVAHLAGLLLVLNGWPAYVGLAFVLLPFALGSRNPHDWFLLTSALLLLASPVLYYTTGTEYGPRYVYEALPFLILLSARGVEAVVAAVAAGVSSVSSSRDVAVRGMAATVPVYLLVLVLTGWSTYGWLTGRFSWRLGGVPSSAASLPGASGADDRFMRLVQAEHPHNALVVIEPCTRLFNASCYLSVFWRNAPTLDGNIVYVSDVGAKNQDVFETYPCRAIYFATYDPARIKARGHAPPPPGGTCP